MDAIHKVTADEVFHAVKGLEVEIRKVFLGLAERAILEKELDPKIFRALLILALERCSVAARDLAWEIRVAEEDVEKWKNNVTKPSSKHRKAALEWLVKRVEKDKIEL